MGSPDNPRLCVDPAEVGEELELYGVGVNKAVEVFLGLDPDIPLMNLYPSETGGYVHRHERIPEEWRSLVERAPKGSRNYLIKGIREFMAGWKATQVDLMHDRYLDQRQTAMLTLGEAVAVSEEVMKIVSRTKMSGRSVSKSKSFYAEFWSQVRERVDQMEPGTPWKSAR